MICFDRIMLISKIDYIEIIDENAFIVNMKNGELIYLIFKQKYPFYILIKIDIENDELLLEFTGKILKNRYCEGINVGNIEYCLSQIEDLGICKLSVKEIIEDSSIIKCDVIKDVKVNDVDFITKSLRSSLRNYRKWVVKGYTNGIVIENNVVTPYYKKRLVVYDKGKELTKAENKDFLKQIDNEKRILEYYENIARFELNIKTMKQIRDLLEVKDNALLNVLASDANPILSVLDEAMVDEIVQDETRTLRDYERELLIRECHNDLAEVEAKVRTFLLKGTSIKRVMKPYIDLYSRLQNGENGSFDVRKLIA